MLLSYPLFAQRDHRWQHARLGSSDTTIGGDGSAITSMAMMVDMTPPEVNARLLDAGCFSGHEIDISSIPYELVFDGKIRYWGQSDWFGDVVSEKEMAKLRQHMMSGLPALVRVASTPDMTEAKYHTMLALGITHDSEIVVSDPWYAVTAPMYLNGRQWWKRVLSKVTHIRWGGVYGDSSVIAIRQIHYFHKKPEELSGHDMLWS